MDDKHVRKQQRAKWKLKSSEHDCVCLFLLFQADTALTCTTESVETT